MSTYLEKKFTSKVAYIIIFLFIIAIIISFAFTGFNDMGGSGFSDTVATVDGKKVSYREYQQAYNQQIQFYSQMFGGKSLTNAQIKQFRIKDNVINRLVQGKQILNLAEKNNFNIGTAELKSEIKKLPYFNNKDGKFDVNLYKRLLQANKYSSSDFENVIKSDLQTKAVTEAIQSLSLSKNFIKEKESLRLQETKFNVVDLDLQKLKTYINVSNDEVKKFADDKANTSLIESIYQTNIKKYSQDEQVQASHILLKTDDPKKAKDAETRINALRKKLTTSNFKIMANATTEDASGKGKGGSLGWFGKGRMVPKFEETAFKMKVGTISEPIKSRFGYHIIYLTDKKQKNITPLAKVQNAIVKEHLQKTSFDKFETLKKQAIEDINKNMNNLSSLKSLSSKYGVVVHENKSINPVDKSVAGVNLSKDFTSKLIQAKAQDDLKDETASSIKFVQVTSKSTSSEIQNKLSEKLKESLGKESSTFAGQVQSKLIESLGSKSKVTINKSIL